MSSSARAPFEFLPLGALIQAIWVGDTNIVQGFPTQALYESHNVPFFGETIGRVANRIADAKITSLNQRSYTLTANNGPNSLHGGPLGWGKRMWTGPVPVGVREIPGLPGSQLQGGESVRFILRSEDGDEGFPGTVDASVIYTTGTQTSAEGKDIHVLGIEYEVQLVGDETDETAVSVTNHSYFNLSGLPNIDGTVVSLSTASYLPVDKSGIPVGHPISYPNITANQAFTLGVQEPDVDDSFVVDPALASKIPIDTRSSPLTTLMSAFHPGSGIHLEVLSTEPAFQFYTGKYIDVPAVEGVPHRGKRSGFCVEPSRYVNAINVPEWRDQVILRKGQVYGSRSVYRAWSDVQSKSE